MGDTIIREQTSTIMEVPSGYRFLPTDLELVRDYLFHKITNHKLPSDVAVVEYDIYATEPWNLPVNNKLDAISSSRSYYFVKLFDGKMTSSIGRRQRVVNPRCYDNGVVGGGRRRGGGGGYWKKIAGGRDSRYIRDESYRVIGIKKSFAFHAYLRSPSHSINNTTAATTSDDDDDNGTTTMTAMTTSRKTNWIMDEYSLNSKRTQPWVLCIVRRKGGVEEDDELQLSILEQVQQQEKEVQPAHDIPHELEALELIKTIQGRIKANQIKIWDDQYKLREISRVRISKRVIKQAENMNLERARNADMVTQLREGKLTRSEVDELRQQRREAAEKEAAAAEAEAVAIRAGTYYHVPLPSRFKRIRRSNEFH